MKKKLFLFILLLILFPNIVLAGGSEDDTVPDPAKWESDVICVYEISGYDPVQDLWLAKRDSLILKYGMDYEMANNTVDIYNLALKSQYSLTYQASNGISISDGFGYDWSMFHNNRSQEAGYDSNNYPDKIKDNQFCPRTIYKTHNNTAYNTNYYICHGNDQVLSDGGSSLVTKDTCAETIAYLSDKLSDGYTYTRYELQNEHKYSTVHYDGSGYQFLYDLNDKINSDMKKITGTTLDDYHKKNVLKFVRDTLLYSLGSKYMGADSWDQYAVIRNKGEVSNKITATVDSLVECTYEGNESKTIKPVKLAKTASGSWVAYLYDGDELKPSANSNKWIRVENYTNYTGSQVIFKNEYLTLDSTTQRCPYYVDYYKDFLSIEGYKYDFTFTPSDSKLDANYGNSMGIYTDEPGEEVESSEESGMTQCESLLGNPDEKGTPAYYLVFIFEVMKYVAIIILIVFTVMEFVSAVPSHDSDIINKTLQKAFKRLIICMVIFVLPTLISFLLSIMDKIPNDLCGIK